jgi:putative membrane protein
MDTTISALLSAVHVLTLALGLGAVIARGRALASPLDEAGSRRLLAADNFWGLAAGLWIASGLGRVSLGGKEPAFYWGNGLFWVKLGLFGLVFLLEVAPMVTFIRVRSARRRGAPLPPFPLVTYRRINAAETALVVVIVFCGGLHGARRVDALILRRLRGARSHANRVSRSTSRSS